MEEYVTVREAAEQLQMKDGTVRHRIRKGLIEALKLPSVGKHPRYRIKKSVVQEIKERRNYNSL